MKNSASKNVVRSEILYDVVVVGGGASGMMAATVAAERGRRVLLLEKNRELGTKVRISGGGRCNITNAENDVRTLLKKYGGAEQALYAPFARFGVPETFAFFEERGLPLVVEANQRTFPKTQKAGDVVRVFEEALVAAGVFIQTTTPVTGLTVDGGLITSILAGKNIYRARSYVFATGGVSHPETGSTGDGFSWLTNLGHTVRPPLPTIVPLATSEAWSHALAGKSLHAKVTFMVDGKKAFAETGNILFTHFGLSGPTVLNAAARVADLLWKGQVTARLDCFPNDDEGALDKRLLQLFDGEKNKTLKNSLRSLLPGVVTAVLSSLPTIDPNKKVHSVTKEERRFLCRSLKALPLTITGLMGFDRAVVADGGVDLVEVDTKTMQSRLIKNLFITGDLLNIRRPSGGYSLQLCWTTGYVAGSSV
jgi:predicted Rossmann fold flavoprotein